MRYLLPDYYEKFACTGENCRDNCCIGWEIMIDDDTWALYETAPQPWKERFLQHVSDDPNDRHFILQNGRCPFLNAKNRCEIILEFGEEALCDICDEHPRFTVECSGWMETGLGLCCEEAARLILSQSEAAAFLCGQSEPEEPPLSGALQAVLERRWKLLALLQNRDYPLLTRLKALLTAEEAGSLPDAAELWTLVAFLKELEYLTPEWPEMLYRAQVFLQLPLEKQETLRQDFAARLEGSIAEYEQLAVYFLFRYYLTSFFDGRPAEKVRLTAAFVSLIEIFALAEYHQTGNMPDFSRRLRLAQVFSKEVEYNDAALEGCRDLLSVGL